MYIMVECLLLVLYYVSKERVYEFLTLSRRIHKIRERKLKEFATDFYPRSCYLGKPKGYWKDVLMYRRILYVMMTAVLLFTILGCCIAGCEPV